MQDFSTPMPKLFLFYAVDGLLCLNHWEGQEWKQGHAWDPCQIWSILPHDIHKEHTHTQVFMDRNNMWLKIFFMNTIKLFNNIQFQTLKLSKRGKKIEGRHMYLISIL